MKTVAILLSLSLLAPAYSQQAEPVTPSGTLPAGSPTEPTAVTPPALPPLTVTAPRPEQKQAQALKQGRLAGGVMALSGAGLLLDAGIIGLGGFLVVWGGALVFVGGLGAYLIQRRLHGENDFGPAGDEASSRPGSDGRVRAPTAPSMLAAARRR